MMKNVEKRGHSYRIQKTINGVYFSATLDHMPTQKERDKIIAEWQTKPETGKRSRDTFARAYDVYIAHRPETFSPSTHAGYDKIFRQIPNWFRNIKVDEITNIDIQKLINDYSPGRKKKTVDNYLGLVMAVIRFYRPRVCFELSLPMDTSDGIEPYIPTTEDIKRILIAAKGTPYEIPLKLACYGLRRSEIVVLTIDDLQKDNDGYYLLIRHALVQSPDNDWIDKPPKTEASKRPLRISKELGTLIRAQYSEENNPERRLYTMYPGNILKHLHDIQDQLGIKRFPLHMMRHFYSSHSHEMGMTDAEIMASGGWSTDYVMKRVYRHADKQRTAEAQKKWANTIENLTADEKTSEQLFAEIEAMEQDLETKKKELKAKKEEAKNALKAEKNAKKLANS